MSDDDRGDNYSGSRGGDDDGDRGDSRGGDRDRGDSREGDRGGDRDRGESRGYDDDGEKIQSLYVGNLSYSTSQEDLEDYFKRFGDIHRVKIIYDRETDRSRGFAFVDVDKQDTDKVIRNTDGIDFQGRELRVNPARPRGPARGGGGGGYGRSGGRSAPYSG